MKSGAWRWLGACIQMNMRILLALILLIWMSCAFESSSLAGPALPSVLMSSSQFSSLHEDQKLQFYTLAHDLNKIPITIYDANLGINQYIHQFDDVLPRLRNESCVLPDLGCLFVGYPESTERVEFKDKGRSIGPQLLLKTFLETEGELNPSNRNKYKGIFAHYKNLNQLTASSEVIVTKLFDQWSRQEVSINSLQKEIFLRPEIFYVLPNLYQKLEERKVSQSMQSDFERLMNNAYLLVIDALFQGANSELSTYPFEDALASPGSLMDIAKLHSVLSKIQNGWPAFAPLTPEIRKSLGGAYTLKTKDETRWQVKALYNDLTNTVWIDYAAPFYENLYVLYHEFWHVLWAHSTASQEALGVILNDLNTTAENSTGNEKLRNDLLTLVKSNEFLALDQQIRFFHATGANAADWTRFPFDSTKFWHDSYMGPNIYHRLISITDRKATDVVSKKVFKFTNGGFDLDWRPRSSIFGLVHREHDLEKWNEEYLKQQLEVHEKVFGKIYLSSSAPVPLDYLTLQRKVLSELNEGKLGFIPPVSLTCSQMTRILNALGSNWQFGVPFSYLLSNSECVDISNPTFPSTEGSHPSTEGSHPALGPQGFPSFEGPEGIGADNE